MPRIVSPNGKVRQVTDKQARGFLIAGRGWTLHPQDAPATPDRPAVNDPKSDWVAYAESVGIDTDGMNKAEVIDVVGG